MQRPSFLMIAQEDDGALATAPVAVPGPVPGSARTGPAPVDSASRQSDLAPAQGLQFRLRASFDQLPEPHVRKLPRAARMGLLLVPAIGLWVAITWLVRVLG